MRPEFSLKYGDVLHRFPAEAGAVYALEEGVTVAVTRRSYEAYGAEEWVLAFANESGHDSKVLSEIWDCDVILPLEIPAPRRPGYMWKEGDPCVISMKGCVRGGNYLRYDQISATEFSFVPEYLGGGDVRLSNVGGRSCDGIAPFFDVTSLGRGYLAAVGWTGDWKAEFSLGTDGVHMKTGLGCARFFLKSGERIRTSSVLVMQYTRGEDKSNKFRALLRDHFSHKGAGCARDGIMATELWGGLTSEEMVRRIGEWKAHGVRFEDVWIDAGWYGNCRKCDEPFSGDWFFKTGDWSVNPQVHPDGLLDVKRAAEEAGMRLMLWFESERVVKGLPIAAAHPDWFLSCPDDNDSLIMNYGNRDALEYMLSLLLGYIKTLGLSCYRQDFNVNVRGWFRAADEKDREGITEIKHITGMYELWDRLLDACPDLIIDNCASGGRRIDIETLKRSIPFFRSDYQCNFNENPEVLQTHNANIQKYLPYNGCTSKTKGDTYAIRSAYSSSFGGAFYNAVFQSMEEEDFAWAKGIVDEYRRIRRYFSLDFYNHGSAVLDETSWAIWQFHDPETQSGILMAFRRGASPFSCVDVALKGLSRAATYRFENLNDGTVKEGGRVLSVTLSEKRSCVIYHYGVG